MSKPPFKTEDSDRTSDDDDNSSSGYDTGVLGACAPSIEDDNQTWLKSVNDDNPSTYLPPSNSITLSSELEELRNSLMNNQQQPRSVLGLPNHVPLTGNYPIGDTSEDISLDSNRLHLRGANSPSRPVEQLSPVASSSATHAAPRQQQPGLEARQPAPVERNVGLEERRQQQAQPAALALQGNTQVRPGNAHMGNTPLHPENIQANMGNAPSGYMHPHPGNVPPRTEPPTSENVVSAALNRPSDLELGGQQLGGLSSPHVYSQVVEGQPHQSAVAPTQEGNRANMNILPSLQERRVNNTEVPTAMAEQQPSFSTIPHSPTTGHQAMHPLAGSGQQTVNIPAGNAATPSLEAGMPVPTYATNNFTSSAPESGFTNASSGGTNTSQASVNRSWSQAFGAPINGETLVLHLPHRILKYLASRLGGKALFSKNWWSLVELHGWNYEQTLYFSEEPHAETPFHSLLKHEDFQLYTVQQLKEDLTNMPRRDILHDLNQRIEEFNGGVLSSNGASQN